MSAFISNSTELTVVRIEFDAIRVPHGKLSLCIATIRPPFSRIPRPAIVRIEQIQLALQLAACQSLQFALEIAVDVVWMLFILDKRPVDEDLLNLAGSGGAAASYVALGWRSIGGS